MNDEWHKALVLTMRKLGIVEILITESDMKAVQEMSKEESPCALMFTEGNGVHIRLATATEAEAMRAEAAPLDS